MRLEWRTTLLPGLLVMALAGGLAAIANCPADAEAPVEVTPKRDWCRPVASSTFRFDFGARAVTQLAPNPPYDRLTAGAVRFVLSPATAPEPGRQTLRVRLEGAPRDRPLLVGLPWVVCEFRPGTPHRDTASTAVLTRIDGSVAVEPYGCRQEYLVYAPHRARSVREWVFWVPPGATAMKGSLVLLRGPSSVVNEDIAYWNDCFSPRPVAMVESPAAATRLF